MMMIYTDDACDRYIHTYTNNKHMSDIMMTHIMMVVIIISMSMHIC